MVRELPIRVPPLDDEPIESWLEAYAARLDLPVAKLAPAIGLKSKQWLWPHRLTVDEVQAIETATGVNRETLIAMTLHRYRGHFPSLDASDVLFTGAMDRVLRGFRWCPGCLTDTGGRWKLRWRLPWSSACTTHRRMLFDFCPECGCRPKSGMMVRPGTLIPPGHCREIRNRAGRRVRNQPCGHDLAAAPGPLLAPDDPLLVAQDHIDQLLTTPTASLARSLGVDMTVGEVMADARILGNHLLGEERFNTSATVTARIVRAVFEVLACDDITAASNRICDDDPAGPARRAGAARVAQPRHWRDASRRLKLALGQSRSGKVKPLDRLRLPNANSLGLPRATIHDRYRKTPGQLWPTWSLRLMPTMGFNLVTYSSVLSTFVVLAHTGFKTRLRMSDEHGYDPVRCRMPDELMRRLDHHDHAFNVVLVLIAIADRLDQDDPVIDYEQRRQLFYDPDTKLLSDADWTQMRKRVGVPAIGRPTHQAQRYLRNLLTGGEPARFFTCVATELANRPGHSQAPPKPLTHKWALQDFSDQLPPLLVRALHDHAARLLADHGIDEPLTWEPPWEWAPTRITWPGPHTDDIDLERVHQLLQQGEAIKTIADRLGTSPHHVRLALRRHPHSAEQQPSATNQLRPRVGLLSPEHVRYRYQDCGWSWQQIADEAGCSKHTAMDIGREAGVTPRPEGRRSTITLDPVWLRTEYVDKQRTVPDIAAELGISPQRVRDKARQFGIPLRPRGGASHAAALQPAVDPGSCPQHLVPAFQGQAAIERVRRFVVIVDQPTITRAAQVLGTTQTVLTSQLARLEADLGEQLIERARPHRPCELTPAGRDFLHHARRILAALAAAYQEATG